MEFKKMSIGNYSYGLDGGLHGADTEPDFDRANDDDKLLADNSDRLSSTYSSRVGAKNTSNFNFCDPEFEQHLGNPSHPNHRSIVNFLRHLAICHTVVIQT